MNKIGGGASEVWLFQFAGGAFLRHRALASYPGGNHKVETKKSPAKARNFFCAETKSAREVYAARRR